MKRGRRILVSIIVVMAMICTLSINMRVEFAAENGGESVITPTMDVWFENNGDSTYVNFHNLIESVQYYVSLYDGFGNLIDDSIPWNDVTMAMDDFSVPLEPGYRIVLEEAISNVGLEDEIRFTVIDYIIPDISVEVANINTETVTGFSNQGLPIDVKVFERDGEVLVNEYSVTADTTGGTFSADFTGICDINPFSEGLIIQPDGLGNQTITNWWAPNPELMVNPMLDTMSGVGWLGPVTVIFDEGLPTEQVFVIPVDPETDSFENVSLGVDLYGGQTLKAHDWMTTRLMTVSTLTLEWVDIFSDQVMMAAEPDAYVQFVIIEGTFPDVTFPVWVEGTTDETGHILFDLSSLSATPYDLNADTWGFTRNYDGHNNATLYEWLASNTPILGDINGDLTVDKADVKLMSKILSGKWLPSPEEKIVADLNQDGRIDAKDLKALNNLLHTK